MATLKSWLIKLGVLAALLATIWYQGQVNTSLKIRLQEVEKSQKVSTERIRELAAISLRLDKAQDSLSKKAKELERQDAELKDYLDRPVPANAARLLNSARAGRGVVNPLP